MIQRDPVELLIFDDTDECPYLPGRIARMPLRMPLERLTAVQLDARLAEGDRRSGSFLYHTACPQCCACEPMRIDVNEFVPSRTQRRIYRRGERLLSCDIGAPTVTDQRVEMFNAHRRARDLLGRDGDIDEDGYEAFLVDSCCDTFEIRYRLNDRLIAVAVCDRGAVSLSAVYCYFDPQFSGLSPGVFSILKQIELCRQWDMRYLYLGLYVAQSEHMSYKSQYVPHERLIGARWHRFDRNERQIVTSSNAQTL